jgi:hypothetical protein
MRLAFRPSLNRLIARLMCWVMLFGWLAGAANACVLQAPLAATAAHAAAHGHAAGEARHHHHHEATRIAHGHGAFDAEAAPGQEACKSLCDSEQSAVAKASTGDVLSLACTAAATPGSYLILPAVAVARAPRPDAGTLPAPPPIPIALLRLTI